MEKITWKELCDYLEKNHDKKGVAVIKQHPKWKKEYPLESRSYIISGDNKHFYDNMISRSIWASSLDGTDRGVRLDHYLWDAEKEDRWEIDYCYIMEDEA